MNKYSADYWIKQLNLSSHPEGGYYRETYRSQKEIDGRSLATNIFYLLPSGIPSRFHRLKYDEHWYFHYGSPMNLYFFTPEGEFEEYILGNDPDEHQHLSLLVPGGTIFGGEVKEPASFVLVSCNMAPGFHFKDFELFSRDEMIRKYPEHEDMIRRLPC
ncbi:MAG: cupin domain-containing protein [Bacteroidales bacterium]